MDIFQYWDRMKQTSGYKHPDDLVVLKELEDDIKGDINFNFPPGPYWGPIKSAKIVLCYANPSINSPSIDTIKCKENVDVLMNQLKGTEKYPYKLNGWGKWFEQKANSLFPDINKEQRLELVSHQMAVINLIPYASENMDNLASIANCLPSSWVAQQFLREHLIPKAKKGEILLLMCRSAHLWGLKSSHGSDNIIINKTRMGFTAEVKSKALAWRKNNL
ncbi:MAG TPA: hypothetical protein ENH88_09065 [Pseudoalteromonas prydzensis]|uniref:Uncharacterized protein n=2 Tax=root TaxID=1 RepID=A0A7V1CYX4_9GAMM|nr:hypothetical protein [Pseudoalteromonas prydzensis]HEA16575.1 hypothetical protein [Pseudoalteromonas prydzensis]